MLTGMRPLLILTVNHATAKPGIVPVAYTASLPNGRQSEIIAYGFLKLMSDKFFEPLSREVREETSLNFALLAFFAVNFVRIAIIARL